MGKQTAGPCEQPQELTGRKAGAECAEIECTIPLGKAGSVRRKQKRDMAELRLGKTEQAVKVDLARRGAQQITAAHHLVHTHEGVVHHNGKLISEHAV